MCCFPPDQREVVCRHRYGLLQHKAFSARDFRYLVDVAHAPERIPCAQARVERFIALRRMRTAAHVRAIRHKHPTGGQDHAGARHQRERGLPRGDMDHVDAHDRVGRGYWPGMIRDVDGEGRLDVRQVVRGRPRLDGSMALHVHFARLEREGGQSLGEVRHVLPRAAADLEHEAAWRQYAREHLEDRLLVALGGGGGLACVHAAMVCKCTRSAPSRRTVSAALRRSG
jgi:hypothetical protein